MPASVQNYEATVTMFQKYTFLSRIQTFGLKNCFNNKISVSSHSACKHSHIKKLFKTICCCNRHHSSDYSLFNLHTVHDHHPSHQSHVHVFHIWHVWWYDSCDDWFWFCLRHLCFWLAMLQPLTPSRLVPSLPCHCTDQFPFLYFCLLAEGWIMGGA